MKSDYWNVTDDQVIEKTGKPLVEWMTILDRLGAGQKKSNDGRRLLAEKTQRAAILGQNADHTLSQTKRVTPKHDSAF